MANFISEAQIEKAIVHLLTRKFGWRHLDCYTAEPDNPKDGSNRASKSEVILHDILKERVRVLNKGVPDSALDDAIARLTARRYAMSQVLAKQRGLRFPSRRRSCGLREQKRQEGPDAGQDH